VVSEGHAISWAPGTIEEFFAGFVKATYSQLARPVDTPRWFESARLLQIVAGEGVDFKPHLESVPIRVWTARLDDIAALGFNLLYLLPIWKWQDKLPYAVTDHFEIDPSVGTRDEVREFVNAAHAIGLKVIFDFIPQGIGDHNSQWIEKHPDWLVRDARDQPFGSHGWGPKPGAPPMGHTYSFGLGPRGCARLDGRVGVVERARVRYRRLSHRRPALERT
jgi:hypothetical protein